MFSLVNLPTAEQLFSALAPYSSEMFDNLKDIVFIATGLMVGALICIFIFKMVAMAFSKIMGRKEEV